MQKSPIVQIVKKVSPAVVSIIISKDLPIREGLKVSEIIFHSALKTQFQYDSNIYLSADGEKGDFITTITPSIGLKIPLRDNNLNLEYDASINEFNCSISLSVASGCRLVAVANTHTILRFSNIS